MFSNPVTAIKHWLADVDRAPAEHRLTPEERRAPIKDFFPQGVRGTYDFPEVGLPPGYEVPSAALIHVTIPEPDNTADLLETAYGIICAVSEGDWKRQPERWQIAAGRLRDDYLKWLREYTKAHPERIDPSA